MYDIKNWTGDAERDRLIREKLEREEQRLLKNRERRQQREKQKGGARASVGGGSGLGLGLGGGLGGGGGGGGSVGSAMSPESSVEKGGTTRKCANCGQVGHIKTNKKLCPMLNGTMGTKVGGDDTTGTYGET